ARDGVPGHLSPEHAKPVVLRQRVRGYHGPRRGFPARRRRQRARRGITGGDEPVRSGGAMKSTLIAFATILSFVAFTSHAAPTTAPSTQTQIQHLQAKVTGVEGLVQVRAAEDKPWQKAAIDMLVDENA